MPSRTSNSMKVTRRRPDRKPEPAVEATPTPDTKEQKPEPKKTKKTRAPKKKATTPEDAILQSSAVDPDLEKAVKPKKAVSKKAISKKSSSRKVTPKKASSTTKKRASKKTPKKS